MLPLVSFKAFPRLCDLLKSDILFQTKFYIDKVKWVPFRPARLALVCLLFSELIYFLNSQLLSLFLSLLFSLYFPSLLFSLLLALSCSLFSSPSPFSLPLFSPSSFFSSFFLPFSSFFLPFFSFFLPFFFLLLLSPFPFPFLFSFQPITSILMSLILLCAITYLLQLTGFHMLLKCVW